MLDSVQPLEYETGLFDDIGQLYHDGYNLHSGSQSYYAPTGKCKIFNDFVTVKFQNVFRDRSL